jgi:hypothetical protein
MEYTKSCTQFCVSLFNKPFKSNWLQRTQYSEAIGFINFVNLFVFCVEEALPQQTDFI